MSHQGHLIKSETHEKTFKTTFNASFFNRNNPVSGPTSTTQGRSGSVFLRACQLNHQVLATGSVKCGANLAKTIEYNICF